MRLLTIEDQEHIIDALERASYEVTCRENLLNHMIRNDLKDTDAYKEYWEEYLYFTKAYEVLKKNFQLNYVQKHAGENFKGRWEVDFFTKEIKLYD
jgi:hypothetical protein